MIMIVHSANGRTLDNRGCCELHLNRPNFALFVLFSGAFLQIVPAQSGFQSEIGQLLWHHNNEQCAPQVPGAVRQQIPFPSQPAGKNAVVWQHASPPPPAVVVYLLEARQGAAAGGASRAIKNVHRGASLAIYTLATWLS